MPNYKNGDGTIPSGLKINIMRHCMENKELLSASVSHATYVGTGNTDADGVVITAALDLTSYVTSTKGAGNTCNIESSDIDSKNFERYDYISILTLVDENTAIYSSSERYIGIRPVGDTYVVDASLGDITPVDTNTLRDAIIDYKEHYPNGEAYAYNKINGTVVYYYDTTGTHSVSCSMTDEVILYLTYSVIYGYQNKPNLYKKVVSNRLYELSVQNALQMNETEQFSSLRGMFGIMGRDRNILMNTNLIKMSPNFNTSWMIYAGLLRFNQLRFITIHEIVDPVAEEFSSQNTYFVFSYGGGCDKILYTESQFTIAKNKNYTIYKMPKFNKDNLYFITAPSHYVVNQDLSIDDSDYEFLDVYSDYDFIRMIRCHYTNSQLSEGVEIGYFSSNFMDSNYISLGYTSLNPTGYLTGSGYTQFEASETWEEASRRYNSRNVYYGYQTRYIIVGYHQYNSSIDKNTFRFTEIKKILHNSEAAIHLTDSTSPHYMIVFKVVEHNTTT